MREKKNVDEKKKWNKTHQFSLFSKLERKLIRQKIYDV